jgi:hypothetical protein
VRPATIGALLGLVLLVGCGGGGGSTSTATTSALTTAGTSTANNLTVPLVDAAAFRDRLVQLGTQGLGRFDTTFGAYQLEQVWKVGFPTLKYSGGGVAADPTTVSIEGALVATTGTDDTVITFAVQDTQGRCAGGTGVSPHGATRTPQRFEAVAGPFNSCSADAVADRYQPS